MPDGGRLATTSRRKPERPPASAAAVRSMPPVAGGKAGVRRRIRGSLPPNLFELSPRTRDSTNGSTLDVSLRLNCRLVIPPGKRVQRALGDIVSPPL